MLEPRTKRRRRACGLTPAFLANLTDLNTQTRHTQFADFHGHGWAFRAVFKKDRKGQLLDHRGEVVEPVTNESLCEPRRRFPPLGGGADTRQKSRAHSSRQNRDGFPVHSDWTCILEKGMHCIDCHFEQDVHGNTKLYGEVRAAIEIQCIDCHGTIDQRAHAPDVAVRRRHVGSRPPEGRPQSGALRTSRAAVAASSAQADGRKIYQNSMDRSTICARKSFRRPTRSTREASTTTSSRTRPRPSVAPTTANLAWGGVGSQPPPTAKRANELHRLPLVVDDELLRLPSAAKGQQEAPQPALRGRRHSQLRFLQLPDFARRRLHAGPRRQRDQESNRPGKIFVCDPRRLLQQQPRVDLRSAADTLGRRHERHRVQQQCPAYGSRRQSRAARPTSRWRPIDPAPTRPRCAATAILPNKTTTTQSWRSC